jgi:HK97 gp10 family phage protein
MANTIDIKVQGLKELQDALREFEPKFQKNVLRGAVRAAAAVIANEAKAAVPVLSEPDERRVPGLLRKSIRVMSTRVSGGMVQGGVAAGISKSDPRPFYARFVEKGTAHMPPKPYLRPALDFGASEAIEALRAYAASRIRDALAARGGVYTEILGGGVGGGEGGGSGGEGGGGGEGS